MRRQPCSEVLIENFDLKFLGRIEAASQRKSLTLSGIYFSRKRRIGWRNSTRDDGLPNRLPGWAHYVELYVRATPKIDTGLPDFSLPAYLSLTLPGATFLAGSQVDCSIASGVLQERRSRAPSPSGMQMVAVALNNCLVDVKAWWFRNPMRHLCPLFWSPRTKLTLVF